MAGNRINITDPVYALLTTDTKEGCTYGAVKSFGEAMEVQINPVLATGDLYGNGKKTESESRLVGIDCTFNLNKVAIETRAEIMGNDFDEGVLTEKANDQPKEIAFGFKVEETGGKAEYVWLLKGKVQPFANNVRQIETNINYSTDSLVINFIPRTFDSALRKYGDTANADFTEVSAKAFLSEVPTT